MTPFGAFFDPYRSVTVNVLRAPSGRLVLTCPACGHTGGLPPTALILNRGSLEQGALTTGIFCPRPVCGWAVVVKAGLAHEWTPAAKKWGER